MGAPTKLNATLLTKMIELHERGYSVRRIARSVKLSTTSVARYFRDRGIKPNGKFKGPVEKKAKVPAVVGLTREESAIEIARAEAELEKVGAPRELLRTRLAIITASMRANHEAYLAGTFNPTTYGKLCDLEMRYARELAGLEPAAEKDPEKDPSTVEASDRLTSKLETLVRNAEKSVRCVNCGAHPFRARE